ncbi:inactive protein kinase SELMODRAFT_444075-like isoform X2 [Macadamia integrifolia]|uniref:inactive protein kinase SELMODRAFT_444075-like isoform X2 n=1 Tax=Macadamia integrifolia TaxID=60698 RepID=UPI001C4E8648|nr:inactive protein kinase SELMODRAFT_444075-like isoform X2 [Macadamia integrifolia]
MEGEVVLVAIDASEELTDHSLEWAVQNLIKPMDSLIFLALLPTCPSPFASGSWANQARFQQFIASLLKKWGLHHNREDSSSQIKLINGVDREWSNRTDETCVKMIKQICLKNRVRQVKMQAKIVSNAMMGSVATEAKELKATWVVLDRHLRKESAFCLKRLNCNIILMDHSTPKILRSINFQLSKSIDVHELQKDPMITYNLGVASALDLNNKGTEYGNFHGVTSSSTECDSAETFSLQHSQLMHREFVSRATYCSTPFIKSQLLNKVTKFNPDGMLKSSATSMKGRRSYTGLLVKSDKNQGKSVILPAIEPLPSRKSTESPRLWHNFGRLTQQKQLLISRRASKDDSENHTIVSLSAPAISRTSSIRRAMSLPIRKPSNPPPLCSMCKHKAPVFHRSPRQFSYQEIERATDRFSSENFLAEGGHGPVFRGVLPDGQVVAVKHHGLASAHGASEFSSKVEELSCAQHKNLVMLVGYCIEKEWLLVYEFACNGSLDNHLYGKCFHGLAGTKTNEVMTWAKRMKVAIGAARGLRYLHEDCRVGCIIHGDFRPNNVLLTHDFEPLVGDFGLARWKVDDQSGDETCIIGSFGYLAPEYRHTGQLTAKADIYAFGIVLMELLSGLNNIDSSRSEEHQILPEWGSPSLEKKMINPCLHGNFMNKEVECMMYAASLCILPHPERRPPMSKVLKILEGDMPGDIAYQCAEWNTNLELQRKSNYAADVSLDLIQDSSPCYQMTPLMHHMKLSPSIHDVYRGNGCNNNINRTYLEDTDNFLNQTHRIRNSSPLHMIQSDDLEL